MNNGGGVLVKVVAVEGVAAHKKNGVRHAKAGGWVDSKRFSCLLSDGDEASNRAQTLKLAPTETADSLTSSLICVSCVLVLFEKLLLLLAYIVHLHIITIIQHFL